MLQPEGLAPLNRLLLERQAKPLQPNFFTYYVRQILPGFAGVPETVHPPPP